MYVSKKGALEFTISAMKCILICLFIFILPLGQASSLTFQTKILLHWKSTLMNKSSLHSWNIDSSACNWTGITCGATKQHRQVITEISLPDMGLVGTLDGLNFSAFTSVGSLSLSSNQLSGAIPSTVGLLSKLTLLNISLNDFTDSIPTEICSLSKLSTMDLSQNQLTGPIPKFIGNLTNLEVFYLRLNNISGLIPDELGKLSRLIYLDLSYNDLDGFIPSSVGNLTELTYCILQSNQLSGHIPYEFHNLVNLVQASVAINNLVGPIHSFFGNFTNLNLLYFHNNQLTGSIPPEIGRLTKMRDLSFSNNLLNGPIPQSFGNLLSLRDLSMYNNRLSGSIPHEIGNLTSLSQLVLSNNSLSGSLPKHLCKGGVLWLVDLDRNNFEGLTPSTLKNCKSLIRVHLEYNKLRGDISEYFGVYPYLEKIYLNHNQLSGQLSSSWGQCSNLTYLNIGGNNITGFIPQEIGSLKRLVELDLSSNYLTGIIPKEFEKLESLYKLNLSDNNLIGEVPIELGKLSHLQSLDLSSNFFNMVPKEIGNCVGLELLNLRENNLNGSIPFQFGNLIQLFDLLDLSSNSLTGEIPSAFANLVTLQNLNLSHNNLTGQVPSSLVDMQSLSVLDLSYNELEGPLPDNRFLQNAPVQWFIHNKNLCGTVKGLLPCNANIFHKNGSTNKIKLIVLIICFGTLFATFIIWIAYKLYLKGRNVNSQPDLESGTEKGGFSIWNFDGRDAYCDIIRATDNFDEKYCIGYGGNGRVYKAVLQPDITVAVKKLQFTSDETIPNIQAFENEISTLTQIRHRNIVKLYGYCSSAQHKFIVYEYIVRGDLYTTLMNDELAVEMEWKKRINIVREVAFAISYMHHDCFPPIVHRDITSKNILLDSEFKASVSDFGTAKFLKPDSSNWSILAGTLGYMAPELAYTSRVTDKCDVYSYGVVVMEVLMGKHPGDVNQMVNIQSQNNGDNSWLLDMADQRLPIPTDQEMEELEKIAKIALTCLDSNPILRPSMEQVVKCFGLQSVRDEFKDVL